MSNLIKCPFCERKYIVKDGVYVHMDKEHNDELNGLSPKQVFFNYKNKDRYELGNKYGKSIFSGKPTKWNEITGRYERFLPEEKHLAREKFMKNMKATGKENIMNDINHQRDMLAARSISGKYKFRDGVEFTYTGSYEHKFLEYLDKILGWPSSDLMAPAPQNFDYVFDGQMRRHFPDFYISSLNLIVNIKSASNKHYRLRDLDREHAQDVAIKSSNYNYIKIYDNQFSQFMDGIEKIKDITDDDPNKKIVIESCSFNDGNEETLNILLESNI